MARPKRQIEWDPSTKPSSPRRFEAGDRVLHKLQGCGSVVDPRPEGLGSTTFIRVDFDTTPPFRHEGHLVFEESLTLEAFSDEYDDED